MRLLAIASALILLSAACYAADGITFTFNPPDGLTGSATYKLTRTMDLGHGLKRSSVSTGKHALSFTRNKDSFLVTMTPVSSQDIRDGRTVTGDGQIQRMVNIMKQAPVTYQLDQGGICVRIFGIEEFIKTMQQRASGAEAQAAAASLRNCQDVLIGQAMDDWNQLVAPYSYRTVRIGDVWKTSIEKPMGTGGSITVAAKFKFLGWVNCGGRRCVKTRVDISCVDIAALRNYLNYMYSHSAMSDAQRAAIPKITKISVKGYEERLIDPATMLYFKESASFDVKFTASLAGYGQRSMVIRETSNRQYAYSTPVVASR